MGENAGQYARHVPKYIVGIDEAGRGPLAGPLVVGLVAMPAKFSPRFFQGIRDSKKLSPKRREEWFLKIGDQLELTYTAVSIPPRTIDRYGIAHAARVAVERGLAKLALPIGSSYIMLDAGLRAPREFHQESIVKGDERIPVIAAASIIAKVTRDRTMRNLHKKYPKYNFDMHKGYGTAAHAQAIRRFGLSQVHRVSFCSRFL